jgi:plasmid stabilization system protein ParE
MEIKWTASARSSLRQIQSTHFSEEETKQYQIELVRRIEQKIAVMLEAMPANEPSWQGTFRILVDQYKVYYSFSGGQRTCFIEALGHQRQNSE